MPTVNEIKTFYDAFLPRLAAKNARHDMIFKSLDKLPIGKTLDIGCGSGLTSKYLAEGGRSVVGIDISQAAIDYARKHNFHPSVKYICAGLEEFETDDQFDVICMVDVLEHLSSSAVAKLFEILNDASHEHTVIYLNIPNPNTTRYLHNHYPDVLQPIDQPYDIGEVIEMFNAIGFSLVHLGMFWMQYVEYMFRSQPYFEMCMNEAFKSLKRSVANG